MGVTPVTGRSARLPHSLRAIARTEAWVVARWLVPLALLHGLLYLVLVPPWQHYDEPNHFLYAAEIAVGEVAVRGSGAADLSREVADSMVRHNFLQGAFRPDFVQPGTIRVGEDQRVHPPLYYGLVGALLRPIRFLAVETQLYAARSLSVLLYALTILAAWRVATVLRPDDRTLQLVIPLVVLLNPAFADLMTAVNNDVLLNFALAAALLGAVLLIRDGPSPVGLLLLLLACGVALATKRTAFAALPPLALALLWSIWRRRVDLRLLLLLAALVVGAAAVSLQPVAVDASTSTYLVFAPRAWLDGLDKTYLRLDLDAWFRSVSDASLIGQRYQLLAMVGFSSFWARLSWGNVALPPLWEWLFLGLALGSLIGLAGGLWRERRKMPLWQRRCIWLFLITVGVACLALVARLHPLPPIEQQIYVPRGRYLFWAMVPVICLICLGVQWFLPLRLRSRSLWILLACFAVTDCVAIGTLAYAFQR